MYRFYYTDKRFKSGRDYEKSVVWFDEHPGNLQSMYILL